MKEEQQKPPIDAQNGGEKPQKSPIDAQSVEEKPQKSVADAQNEEIEKKLKEIAKMRSSSEREESVDVVETPFQPDQEEKEKKKKKRTRVILGITAACALLLGAFLVITRFFNTYQRLMKNLSFDYREGETVTEEQTQSSGSYSEALAKSIGDQRIEVEAVYYRLSSSGEPEDMASRYSYTRSPSEVQLRKKTGIVHSFFTATEKLRTAGNGYEKKSLFGWKEAEDVWIPPLYDYFFTVSPHDSVGMEFYSANETTVNEQPYHCEIWLMSSALANGSTEYCTVYRYFSGDRLAGVCVLSSLDSMTDVYAIDDYHIEN